MQDRYGNLQIRKNKRRKKRIADPHLETKAGALIWLKIQEIKILILSKQISNDSVEFLWLPVQIPVFGSVYETKAVLFQSASLRLGTLLRPVFLPSFCKANTFFPKCFLFSVLSTKRPTHSRFHYHFPLSGERSVDGAGRQVRVLAANSILGDTSRAGDCQCVTRPSWGPDARGLSWDRLRKGRGGDWRSWLHYSKSLLSLWGLSSGQHINISTLSVSTDISSFHQVSNHFFCPSALPGKYSVSAATAAQTIQANAETNRPQITHL